MKNYFTLPFLLLLAVAAHSQTYVSGFINANTTWNMAGSPYIVNGNALLSHGYTLTIDPGVVVKFDTNRTLQIDGELHAVGTAANRITFTSLKASPQAGDWGKIHFSDTCVDAVFDTAGNYITGCIMKYCDVMYGGSLGFGEIHIIISKPYFSHCNILNSSSSGIYASYASYSIDSSSVKGCKGSGLYFEAAFIYSSNLIIQDDTIASNSQTGIYIPGYYGYLNRVNQATIRRNYFLSNTNGALYGPGGQGDILVLYKNIFESNTGPNSIVSFAVDNYIVECNKFINNQLINQSAVFSTTMSDNIITYPNYIRNNLFDGNINGPCILINIPGGRDIYLMNNILQNNINTNGKICFLNGAGGTFFHLHYNSFIGNKGNSSIYIGGVQGLTKAYMDMSLNNFVNPNCQYELINAIPYGGTNLYLDSNYWGTTSTQHIDSVVYDYFDYGNYSVVFYQPVLTTRVEIDTTCSLSFPTTVSSAKTEVDGSSKPFPNPFSTYTEITLGKELKDASLLLFNVFGQKVKEITAINGKHISLRREALPAGIYIYQIIEKGRGWRMASWWRSEVGGGEGE